MAEEGGVSIAGGIEGMADGGDGGIQAGLGRVNADSFDGVPIGLGGGEGRSGLERRGGGGDSRGRGDGDGGEEFGRAGCGAMPGAQDG